MSSCTAQPNRNPLKYYCIEDGRYCNRSLTFLKQHNCLRVCAPVPLILPLPSDPSHSYSHFPLSQAAPLPPVLTLTFLSHKKGSLFTRLHLLATQPYFSKPLTHSSFTLRCLKANVRCGELERFYVWCDIHTVQHFH